MESAIDGAPVPTPTNSKSTKKPSITRTTISLSPDAEEKLDWLAEIQHVSRNDAIRRAIATEAYIREALDKGAKILVQKADQSIHELVFIR